MYPVLLWELEAGYICCLAQCRKYGRHSINDCYNQDNDIDICDWEQHCLIFLQYILIFIGKVTRYSQDKSDISRHAELLLCTIVKVHDGKQLIDLSRNKFMEMISGSLENTGKIRGQV